MAIKIAKDRITALVCCSLDEHKKRLLVIGKAKNPQCFKNVQIQSLPVDYESSRNAWMTGEIWSQWLKKWDRQLRLEGRKIALIIDNCSAHGTVSSVTGLTQISIHRLPPNTTSIIQSCIISALEETESGDMNANVIAKKMTMLDAIYMLYGAWVKVTESTIGNCWVKARFSLNRPDNAEEEDAGPAITGPDVDMTPEEFDQWVSIDDDASVT